MRITESKLRSIIRSVIAESDRWNTYLQSWATSEKALEKFKEILGVECSVAKSDNLIGIKAADTNNYFLSVDGDHVHLWVDQLEAEEEKQILKYFKDDCGVLQNSRICAGVLKSEYKGGGMGTSAKYDFDEERWKGAY